jgi:hypothetical protein
MKSKLGYAVFLATAFLILMSVVAPTRAVGDETWAIKSDDACPNGNGKCTQRNCYYCPPPYEGCQLCTETNPCNTEPCLKVE